MKQKVEESGCARYLRSVEPAQACPKKELWKPEEADRSAENVSASTAMREPQVEQREIVPLGPAASDSEGIVRNSRTAGLGPAARQGSPQSEAREKRNCRN